MAKNKISKVLMNQKEKGDHTPSPRRIRAVKNMRENGGNQYRAMIDAGYSPEYAKNPAKFKAAKSTQDLLDLMMPRDLVADVHRGLLKSKKLEYMQFAADVSDEDVHELAASTNSIVKKIVQSKFIKHVWLWVSNDKSRKDAVEMAYKLRGEFAAEKFEINDPIKQMSDAELVEEIRSIKKFFKKEK